MKLALIPANALIMSDVAPLPPFRLADQAAQERAPS